jgi:hydrogenase-4 membrane subunit HyfE
MPSILLLLYWLFLSIRHYNINYIIICCILIIVYFVIEYIMTKEAREIITEEDEIMQAFLERFNQIDKREDKPLGEKV